MSGKSLTRGFRCLNCRFKSLPPFQRNFTTSPIRQKHGAVPAFTPTSNPELDAHLLTIRNKIFVPAHLSRSQQDLIYLDKNQRELSIEPVYAYIKGEKFELEHIDRMKDVPAVSAGILQAMKLMKESKDWDNLPALLQGMKNAKRHISKDFLRITRKAGIAGRPDVMVECARRVDDTGYRLSHPSVACELMYQIQGKAAKSSWAAKETKQALAMAESVYKLLEDERHGGKKNIKDFGDVRVKPEVVGVLLQLSAVWATKFFDGEDRDAKVKLYAEKLMQAPASTLFLWEEHISRISAYLSYMTPVLQGMKLALPILGESEGLAERIAELDASVVARKELLLGLAPRPTESGTPVRGLATYNELLGPDATKVESTARRHKTGAETTEATVQV